MGNTASIYNYEQLEIIGRGSYGEVHKIRNKETKEILAIKILYPELNKNLENYMKSLINEVEIYSKLDHPCILPFIGGNYFSFNDEQRPAIIFKYACNGSLDRIIEFGRQYERVLFWDNTRKLCCIYGISVAMEYLHEKNIIHYDLKPSNILLDEHLFPLITDFGISKFLDKMKKSLPATTLNGTIYYTAPEVWKKLDVTTACDVYSFAFVLYSIFTNEEPNMNYNQYQFFINVIHNGERPELNSKIPPPFQSLIKRCWAENPSDRPSFKEITNELIANKDYIFEDVDVEKFEKYVQLINQKCKTDLLKNEFQEIDINKELKKEPVIDNVFETLFKERIAKLDELPVNKKQTIKDIIFQKGDNVNFYKIKISSDQIANLYEDQTLESDYMLDLLKFFRKISIYLKFPTKNFEQIMKILMIIKSQKMKRIKMIANISDVNAIGDEFINNDYINKINIYPPVSFIQAEAFRGCISLKIIKFPNCLISIEHSLFRMCENLKRLVIPPNVESIGPDALRGCHSLIEVSIPPSVKKIGKSCFRGDNHIEHITLPANLILIEKATYKGCVKLKTINIPPNVIKIEMSAFEECQQLKKVIIPQSVNEIESNAFRDCTSLTHIYYDPSNTSIHKDAFNNCKNLHLLIITTTKPSVKIDTSPFPHVKEILIINNVTSIDNPLPGIQISTSSNYLGFSGITEILDLEDINLLDSIMQ